MIFYNSLLAKWFLGKENRQKNYFMVCGFFFTRYKYLEAWEDMEMRIHARQFWECFLLTLLPALVLSLVYSWWWKIHPFMTYHIFYWLEKTFRPHSVFDWEAIENCGDSLYIRKRKSYAWMKWYGKKTLPLSDWDD